MPSRYVTIFLMLSEMKRKWERRRGVDAVNDKATYPNLYGLDKSKEKLEELTQSAVDALAEYYDNAELFVNLARELVHRGSSMSSYLSQKFS